MKSVQQRVPFIDAATAGSPAALADRPAETNSSRSPPGAKNLQHVPCKFFRQGMCSAGKNCLFSHNLDAMSDRAVCKYFTKGNCKFGARCALAHVLSDGRRVNKPHNYSANHHQQHQHGNHAAAAPHPRPSPPMQAADAYTGQNGLPVKSMASQIHSAGNRPLSEFRDGLSQSPFGSGPFAESEGFGGSGSSGRRASGLTTSPPSELFSPLDVLSPQRGPHEAWESNLSQRLAHDTWESNLSQRLARDAQPSDPEPPLFSRPNILAASVPTGIGLSIGKAHASPGTSQSGSRYTNNYVSAKSDPLMRQVRASPSDAAGFGVFASSMSALSLHDQQVSASVPSRYVMGSDDLDDDAILDGEEFIPGSLQELLTPQEKSRRMSRNEEEGGGISSSVSSRLGMERYAGSPLMHGFGNGALGSSTASPHSSMPSDPSPFLAGGSSVRTRPELTNGSTSNAPSTTAGPIQRPQPRSSLSMTTSETDLQPRAAMFTPKRTVSFSRKVNGRPVVGDAKSAVEDEDETQFYMEDGQ